jgi:hypothetical protein
VKFTTTNGFSDSISYNASPSFTESEHFGPTSSQSETGWFSGSSVGEGTRSLPSSKGLSSSDSEYGNTLRFSESQVFVATACGELVIGLTESTELNADSTNGPDSVPLPFTVPPSSTVPPHTTVPVASTVPLASTFPVAEGEVPRSTVPPLSTVVVASTVPVVSMSPLASSNMPATALLVSTVPINSASTVPDPATHSLSLMVSGSEVLKPTSFGIGTNAAAETDDSSGDVVWLVIAIVAMVVFVCLFSYLIHKEGKIRARTMNMKQEKEKEKMKQITTR